MRADRIGRDTVLAQIVQMVAQAQRSRAPIQRLADQVSGWFAPLVIAVAALAFLAWAIWGPEPRLAYGLVAAVSVLIIACPCEDIGMPARRTQTMPGTMPGSMTGSTRRPTHCPTPAPFRTAAADQPDSSPTSPMSDHD